MDWELASKISFPILLMYPYIFSTFPLTSVISSGVGFPPSIFFVIGIGSFKFPALTSATIYLLHFNVIIFAFVVRCG